MNLDALFFNGISGLTGTYGLPPVTGEDLGERIRQASRQPRAGQQVLEGVLSRDSADQVVRIVRLLADSNVQDRSRDAAWHRNWLLTLARELAELLLGKEYTTPERLDELADRLAQPVIDQAGHPVDRIVRIVECLAKGQARELEELLLTDPDKAPDDRTLRQARLDRQARTQLFVAQTSVRTASKAGELATNVAAQSAWLGAWIAELRDVPMDALISQQKRKAQIVAPLVEKLEFLARSHRGLDPLLTDLRAQPRDIPWNDLLDLLHRGIEALLRREGDEVLWPGLLTALNGWLTSIQAPFARRGTIEGIDPTDLAQAGWGIVLPYEDSDVAPKAAAIQAALQPLLERRRSLTGGPVKIYAGRAGYRPGETASDFLARYDARPSDPVDPRKVPYYLLLIGTPEEIPFHVQYQLDVQYAVGRIDFGDNLEAYARYARSVVAAETGGDSPARQVTFFAPTHPGDPMTQNSAASLVEPLYEELSGRYGSQIGAVLRGEATKARLRRLLGGEEAPALLFVACHGMEFPRADAQGRQARCQGALLCQEWRGPGATPGEVPSEYYFSAADLAADADLSGLIAFFFACYSAGTPRYEEYTHQAFREQPDIIADRPFTAALPRAMLSLSKGALAVVGHVERAWGTSFLGPRHSRQIAVFQSAVERLLKGQPVGLAMEYFNGRYAAVSTELNALLEPAPGQAPDAYKLAELWTASNDARGYVVLGDPAVRLPAAAQVREETSGGRITS